MKPSGLSVAQLIRAAALLSAAVWLSTTTAIAAELIMIEQQHCEFCEKFNREIAEAYPKTDEGKTAPLRRVDLHEEWPADLSNVQVERFTPTFVLVHEGQEIDRIVGYPGDEFFWHLLNDMLEQLEDE